MRSQVESWNDVYKKEEDINGVAFPSEYVIRMFKGSYPKLDFKAHEGGYKGKSILDISGGGSGRDLIVFKQVGFEKIAATEISSEIVEQIKLNSGKIGIDVDAQVGTNRELPFGDSSFDYLLSWNVCYYFDDDIDFDKHVLEYARVLKPGGILVFSIPKANCFIYRDCIDRGNGLAEITNDPFGARNGVILRRFSGEDDIELTFGNKFENFVFGSIEDDCFGLNYSWHIGYCKRRVD